MFFPSFCQSTNSQRSLLDKMVGILQEDYTIKRLVTAIVSNRHCEIVSSQSSALLLLLHC